MFVGSIMNTFLRSLHCGRQFCSPLQEVLSCPRLDPQVTILLGTHQPEYLAQGDDTGSSLVSVMMDDSPVGSRLTLIIK